MELETSCHNLSCQKLKDKIKELESRIKELESVKEGDSIPNEKPIETSSRFNRCPLSNQQIERYSRQIILPEIAVQGQVKIENASVLIVGAGGLGCPAALYLTSAGVGKIGVVDYDMVDLSNLHRQVLHREDTVGHAKVHSIMKECKRLNSSVHFTPYHLSLSSQNALDIIKEYDIVLDCTDNVATRYLLNDACVLAKKTLVSGSALRFEGQLTVYNHAGGPCYRCLYPSPPPAETVTNCSDGGVIGAVTGVIGSLQALEALKIISGNESSFSGKLLLFDGLSGMFRNIRLRQKKDDCPVCGVKPSITKLQDYEEFCGAKASDKDRALEILSTDQRISVQDYEQFVSAQNNPHVLIDVRSKEQYEICSLKEAKNLPIDEITMKKNFQDVSEAVQQNKNVYFICRRGNDSQKAVLETLKFLRTEGVTLNSDVKDIKGGLTAWSRHVDSNFPVY